MRYWAGAALAFALAIVQASSVSQFRIFGATPNLLLVMLVAWLVVRGLEDVLPMIGVAGVTLGLVGLQTPGVALLALLPVALLGVAREAHVLHSQLLLALALVAAASFAYHAVLLLAVFAGGGVFAPLVALRAVVLPAAVVNVVLAIPVYGLMRFVATPARRGALSF